MGVLGALIAGEYRGRPAAKEHTTQTGLAGTVGSGRAARRAAGTGWLATAKQTAVGIAHGAAKVWVGTDTFGATAAPPWAHDKAGDGTASDRYGARARHPTVCPSAAAGRYHEHHKIAGIHAPEAVG